MTPSDMTKLEFRPVGTMFWSDWSVDNSSTDRRLHRFLYVVSGYDKVDNVGWCERLDVIKKEVKHDKG